MLNGICLPYRKTKYLIIACHEKNSPPSAQVENIFAANPCSVRTLLK